MNTEKCEAPNFAPWTLWLCAVVLLLAATQGLLLPLRGLNAGVADLLALAALAGVLWELRRTGARLEMPLGALLFLLLFGAAALGAGAGRGGAVELAQRVEQLFAGLVIFSVLLAYRAAWLPWLVGAGLAANIGAALLQLAGAGPLSQVRGLFANRIAFSFYVVLALACLQPWLFAARLRWRKTLLIIALTALALTSVTHGQILVPGVLVLICRGFLHSRRAGLANLLAGAIVLGPLFGLGAAAGGRHGAELRATLSPFTPAGLVKQAHTETVAALRLAAAHPLVGVGGSRYQENVGRYYLELRNPNFNEIEPGHQSGWGILAATAGWPVAIVFMLLLLGALAAALRGTTAGRPEAAAAVGCLAMIGIGMLVSDVFVRGLGWFVPLALVCARGLATEDAAETCICETRGLALGWRGILAWGAAFAGICALTAALGGTRPQGGVAESANLAVPGPAALPTIAESAKPVQARPLNLFRVLGAVAATEVTAPMERAADAQAAGGTLLRIPDAAGVPPADAEPDMKYGGARFDLEAAAAGECRVWLRVWWEGSCGNTLSVRVNDGPALTIGNDGNYNVWQWLQVPGQTALRAGTNRIYVLNREDGVRFDQMLVTGDLRYVPQGIETE